MIRLMFGGLKRLFWKLENVALVRCENKQLRNSLLAPIAAIMSNYLFSCTFTMDNMVDVCWAYKGLF